MRYQGRSNRFFGFGWRMGLAGLVTAAALGIYFRQEIQAHYMAYQISQAGDAEAIQLGEKAGAFGEAAVSPLTLLFQSKRPSACTAARGGLEKITKGWEAEDPRKVQLARNLARGFPNFSPSGQAASLTLVSSWIASEISTQSPLYQPVAALLGQVALQVAEQDPNNKDQVVVAQAGLSLLRKMNNSGVEAKSEERLAQMDLLRQIMRKADPGSRRDAIGVVIAGGFDLHDDLVACLQDPVAEVRRGAVLALGPAQDTVRDDVLLGALHDSDPEVSRLAELALQSRGLTMEHIRLGKLLTHSDPSKRLQVLDLLNEFPDLDEKLWLDRLSHDRSASVRAAAARALSQRYGPEATDRLKEMAGSDPSPAVNRLAKYYLSQQARGR